MLEALKNNRSQVSQIVDHRYMKLEQLGKGARGLAIQVEWQNEDGEGVEYSWEPILNIYRDIPEMVQSYCEMKSLDLKKIIDREADKQLPQHMRRQKAQNQSEQTTSNMQAQSRSQNQLQSQKHRFIQRAAETRAQEAKANFQLANNSIANSFFSVGQKAQINFQEAETPFGQAEPMHHRAYQSEFSQNAQEENKKQKDQYFQGKEVQQRYEQTCILEQEHKNIQDTFYQDYSPELDQMDQEMIDQTPAASNKDSKADAKGQENGPSLTREVAIGVVGFQDEVDLSQQKALPRQKGQIQHHVPKKVHAVSRCPQTGGILYLCSWEQDFKTMYFSPTWIHSEILNILQYHHLVVEYYEMQVRQSTSFESGNA